MGRIADVCGIKTVEDARFLAEQGADDLFLGAAHKVGKQLAQRFKVKLAGDIQFLEAGHVMQLALKGSINDICVVAVAQNGFAQAGSLP